MTILAVVVMTVRLVGAHEIRVLLASTSRSGSMSRQRAYQLTSRADFPAPIATLVQGKVWWTEDVENWIHHHGAVVAEWRLRTTWR